MSSKQSILSKELRLAGAKDAETDKLVEVASQLQRLKALPLPSAQPNHGQHWWRWRHTTTLATAAVLGIVVGASLVAYSQTSLPGSWLYPSKRLSEKVAVAVDPSYRATLMMRRSQEVKDLIGKRANQPIVLATLADYRTEAAAYKSANYAAFEFCESNLRQAASIAPSQERAAINSTLSSLRA